MKSKILFVTLLTLSLNSFSQEKKASPIVTGTGIAGTLTSAYFAYDKFSTAGKIVKENTQMLLPQSGNSSTGGITLAEQEISAKTNIITEGDDATVKYHLNEVKNRAAWVDHYIDASARETSNASSYRGQALAAMLETETIRDSKGNVTGTRIRPNPMKALMYNNMASDADAAAIKYTHKAQDVRAGAPVEWMEMEKNFSGKATSKIAVANEMKAILADGGKLFSVSRLEAKMVQLARSNNIKGGIFTAVGVLSAGATIYDYITGKISNMFSSDSNSYSRLDSDRSPSSKEEGSFGTKTSVFNVFGE